MDGVSYISREEAKQAISKASERKQRQEEPMKSKIPTADKESLEFVEATRQEIQSWLSSIRKVCHFPSAISPGLPRICSGCYIHASYIIAKADKTNLVTIRISQHP